MAQQSLVITLVDFKLQPQIHHTLCLTEMKAGGARDFKEVLDNALSDIDQACQAVIHKPVTNKILASLKTQCQTDTL